MSIAYSQKPGQTPCLECPLLDCSGLRPLEEGQRHWMQTFKQGEIDVGRGNQVLVQGARTTQLFTVLRGILMRYRLLEDGRRQILNFMFPGDLIGLQAAMGEPMLNSVEALTAATLCVFKRDRFADLVAQHPDLSFDVIWLASKEEQALEEHMVALGQRTAQERIAYLAVFLVNRAKETGAAIGNSVTVSITQNQIADMLGLSLVHTNRSLQALRKAGLIIWNLSEIRVEDMAAATEFSHYEPRYRRQRPFL